MARARGRGKTVVMLLVLGFVIGGAGGALNGALSDGAAFWPRIIMLAPGATWVLRIGILGNMLIGGAAGVGLLVGVHADVSWSSISGAHLALVVCSAFFVAFVSARWVTNETDKLVLRKAVFKAVSAPAAHPETVGQMQSAPPDRLYRLVDGLLPTRAGHR